MRSQYVLLAAAVSLSTGCLSPCSMAAADTLSAKPDTTVAKSASSYMWRNVAIVGGGFVSGIVTSPAQKGLMYARTDIGGAYRWNDTAKRWESMSDWVSAAEWNFTGVESIAADPTDAARVYMAVGTYTSSWAGNGAILRSSDQGRTWARADLPFKNGGNEDGRSIGERLAVDPNDPRVLYFGTRHAGLWRSSDRGATWAKVDSFPAQADEPGKMGVVGVGWVVFGRGDKGAATQSIYAGTGNKTAPIYHSADGGASWSAVPGQPSGFIPHRAVLAADGSALYVSYSDGPGPNGVASGMVAKLQTAAGVWTDITPKKGAGGYAGLAADAANPGTVVVATMDRWALGDTIFRTTDGGATWHDIAPKAVRDPSLSPYLKWGGTSARFGWWIGALAIDPFQPGHALYGTGATIWATNDLENSGKDQPTHWYVGAGGIEETVVNEIVSPPSGAPLLSVMWDIDGFRHADVNVSPQNGFYSPSHGRNTGIDFAETDPKIVARVYGGGRDSTGGAFSTDNGVSWTPFASSPPVKNLDGAIAVSADGAAFVWSVESGETYVSRDRGATWAAATGLPPKLRAVSDRMDSSRFYAFDRSSGTLYASRDGGASFAPAATGLPAASGFLRAAPGFAGDLWLATEKGLLHSTDGGARFTAIAAGRIGDAHRIGFGRATPGSAYPAVYLVGTVDGTYGIYRSDDAGATWVRVNDDAHQFGSINSITGDPRVYGRVYIGSANRGIQYGEMYR